MRRHLDGECTECASPYSIDEEVPLFGDHREKWCPADWAHVVVSLDEPVIGPELEQILDQMLGSAPAEVTDAYLSFLRKGAPRFQMSHFVCPACQESGKTETLWKKTKEAYLAAVEKQVRETPPGMVLPFRPPADL